uniref:G2/mitotic-specific cyclin-B3-like n=1 Tax=Jaculus jaculus TaxID=51337 RepID=UPI001E1B1725|nr:G2/mitotic-specific cyclin-B3-like [Jaculus jaculus]
MPRQLPHKISNKEETTKYQSGNIVSSDHYLSKKKEEKNPGKIFSSSLQRTVRTRSAFEEITNVSPSQLVQSKKKDDIESIKDVFKSMKRKTQILQFDRNNLKKAKTCNVELVRVGSSTNSVPNMGIFTTSEIQITSKAPAFKEVLVLIEETPRINSILKKPLKRCMTNDKVPKLEEPLTLLEEMDHNDEPDIEPVTFGKKYKPEKSSITEDSQIQEDSDTLGKNELEVHDPLFNSVYTKEIFSYLKEREEKLILQKYMHRQTELSAYMRAILVDWLVEVQMNLEMSHETLYLAVKLVDHYLMKVFCTKSSLQLLGSTALWIAAKFEDPHRPCLNTFLYICAYKYQKHEMLAMEGRILKALNFDINIPIAYNFLRLYALHLHASMRTLTLSRFICEMTLQEYDYIQEKPSKLSAACFLLALYMKNLKHWAPSLEDCSGYQISELHPMVKKLNMLLTAPSTDDLRNVYSKYSEEAFFAVSQIPPLDKSTMEKI